MRLTEAVSYIVTVCIGALFAALPFLFPQLLPQLEPEAYERLAFTLSIVVLIIGDRIASAQREAHAYEKIDALVGRLESQIPELWQTRQFSTASEALFYLAAGLVDAVVVRSTRMAEDLILPHRSSADVFERAMEKAIEVGARWHDVFSGNFADLARERQSRYQHMTGSYKATIVDCRAPTVNFTIVTRRDKTKEVVFGWVMSGKSQDEVPAFASSDLRIVKFYEDYFDHLLFSAGLREK
jgi:hypothetical protein